MTLPHLDRSMDVPCESRPSPPTALAAFQELAAAEIRSSLWKGTVRLEQNLRGGGDLDLLVHEDDVERFRRILAATGWRRPVDASRQGDPAAEDHLLVDGSSGRLVHVDASVRLRPDGFARTLPATWHTLILGRSRLTCIGVPAPDPAVEAALLLLRLAKQSHPLSGLLRARRPLAQRRAELSRLTTATSPQEILDAFATAVAPRAVPAAATALRRPSRRNLARVRRRLGRAYRPARPSLSHLLQARQTTRRVLRALNIRWFHRPVLLGRGRPGGGLIVAVVGSDGSGKSTLVRRLTREYTSKFDTLALYLGSGDGPVSLLRLPMKIAHGALRSRAGSPGSGDRPTSAPMVVARAVWALALAREKRQRLRRAQRARSRGYLVICDRYPQVQFPGENDGPLLSAWRNSSSPVLRRLAGIERRPYDLAVSMAPDLVLRLDVDVVTARARRPRSTTEHLAHRSALVQALEWDRDSTLAMTLDATAPADEVFRLASLAIWQGRRP